VRGTCGSTYLPLFHYFPTLVFRNMLTFPIPATISFYLITLVQVDAFIFPTHVDYSTQRFVSSSSSSTSSTSTSTSLSFLDTKSLSTNTLLHDTIMDDTSPETTTTTTTTTADTTALSLSTTASIKSYLDDGFIFGLQDSGLHRPKGKVASLVVEGDSLETTPLQIGIVTGTLMAHAIFALTSIWSMAYETWNTIAPFMDQGSIQSLVLTIGWTIVQTMGILGTSWILADFGSGVLHWAVDNYGNGRTPIMGSIIAAFQGHHAAPWTITKRGFANNVYKLCLPFGLLPLSILTILTTITDHQLINPNAILLVTSFCVLEILSQEFHKWSHNTKHDNPNWVRTLQNLGLTVGPIPHMKHHQEPFDGNYCIISGFCNSPLDNIGFFRRLEYWIYQWNGVESNAWKLDPTLKERTLRGDFSKPMQ
jgi:palmitoyl-[glycerolipid] 3-(E)-desaturase